MALAGSLVPAAGLDDGVAIGDRCAVRSNGDVACWNAHTAVAIEGVHDAVAGYETAGCALQSTGSLICWGYGTGPYELLMFESNPQVIADIDDVVAIDLSGSYGFCLLRASGSLGCLSKLGVYTESLTL